MLSTTLLPSAATLRMFHELSIFAPARSSGASCCPGSSQSREAPETNHSPGNSSACGQGRQSKQRQQGGMLLGGAHAQAPQSLCSTPAVLGQDTQLWRARTAWEL